MAGEIGLYKGAMARRRIRDAEGDPVEIAVVAFAAMFQIGVAHPQAGVPHIVENRSGDIVMSPEQFFRL